MLLRNSLASKRASVFFTVPNLAEKCLSRRGKVVNTCVLIWVSGLDSMLRNKLIGGVLSGFWPKQISHVMSDIKRHSDVFKCVF